jgi:hypothetical protein
MTTTTRTISIALAALALTASTTVAVAKPIRDSGEIRPSSSASTTAVGQDLRNPDNRSVANALAQERSYGSYASPGDHPAQDVRSPDARDAAAGRGTFNAPDVTVVKLAKPASGRADGGFDWSDAGIGAVTLLAVIALGLGGAVAIMHRRRRGTRTAIVG